MARRHVACRVPDQRELPADHCPCGKGANSTFDTSCPITVIPTWISGPEPGDTDSGEDKSIEITMQYRIAEGETGKILLTYWTPMRGREASLPPDQ
jgi:hypothetical protein